MKQQAYATYAALLRPIARPIARRLSFLVGLLYVLAFWFGTVAAAQERVTLQASFTNNAQPIKIDVLMGQTRIIDFDQAYERVSVSDNKVAEVVPVTDRQILINGLLFGQVNVIAWQKQPAGGTPRMLVFDLYVQFNLMLIDNQIKILFPKENIQLSQVNNSVVLSGTVSRPEIAEQVQKIIEATNLKVNNLIKAPILDAAQVQLQIRVAEVNRSVLKEFSTAYGIANSSVPAYVSSGGPAQLGGETGSPLNRPGVINGSVLASTAVNLLIGNLAGSAGVLGFIRALQQRGAFRELAEPNLIAMHGHKASFLAGGEFPIPIIQSVNQGQSAITVIFKEFGVKLNFQPTILDENHIRLELEPEVSSLDFASGVKVQSIVIPGLRVRRAKTVVELRDGQSFALAGLIDNTEQVNLSKVPLLGDVPILGELFKSRNFQRNETELMFLVTVKMVEPLNSDQLPKLPGVSELKPTSPSPVMPSASIEGQAGHSIAVPRATTAPQTVVPPVAPAPLKPPNDLSNQTAEVAPNAAAPANAAPAPIAPTTAPAETAAAISEKRVVSGVGKAEPVALTGVKTTGQHSFTLKTSAGIITIPVGASGSINGNGGAESPEAGATATGANGHDTKAAAATKAATKTEKADKADKVDKKEKP